MQTRVLLTFYLNKVKLVRIEFCSFSEVAAVHESCIFIALNNLKLCVIIIPVASLISQWYLGITKLYILWWIVLTSYWLNFLLDPIGSFWSYWWIVLTSYWFPFPLVPIGGLYSLPIGSPWSIWWRLTVLSGITICGCPTLT